MSGTATTPTYEDLLEEVDFSAASYELPAPRMDDRLATRLDIRFSGAGLQLPFLDPQVARELGVVTANLLDEALGVLAADERLDGVAERVSRTGANVDDRVHEHRFREHARSNFVPDFVPD